MVLNPECMARMAQLCRQLMRHLPCTSLRLQLAGHNFRNFLGMSSRDALGTVEAGICVGTPTGQGAEACIEWQTPEWEGRYASACVSEVFEALTTAIEGIRVAELIDDEELAQLRQVCMACTAQEAVILSAALAAQPDNSAGHQEFLGIMRTIANKPIPTGTGVHSAVS